MALVSIPVTSENTNIVVFSGGLDIGNLFVKVGSISSTSSGRIAAELYDDFYVGLVGTGDYYTVYFKSKTQHSYNAGVGIRITSKYFRDAYPNDGTYYASSLSGPTNGWYYGSFDFNTFKATMPIIATYPTLSDFLNEDVGPEPYPITYRLTNCSAPSAPEQAAVGNIVNVPLVMQEGYGIITPSTDILVTNNGVAVPYTFSDNTISFTMPDPS